jgi:hypothetical protein
MFKYYKKKKHNANIDAIYIQVQLGMPEFLKQHIIII